jgi:hypothetical protein
MSDYTDKKSTELVKVPYSNGGNRQVVQIKQKYKSLDRDYYYFKENIIDPDNNVYMENEIIIDTSNSYNQLVCKNNKYQIQPFDVLNTNENISMEKMLIYAIIFILVYNIYI